MKLNRSKKALLILSTYFTILLTMKLSEKDYDVEYNDNYEIGCDDIYATCNDKKIYIGDESYIESIRDICSNNIYIIDSRDANEPDMKICSSYSIINNKEKSEILDLLLKYESDYPSDWNRTKESMYNEWIIHNICYFISIKRERTETVDLDNKDENKFNSKVLYKILK